MVDIVAGRYVLLDDSARSGGLSTVRKATSLVDGSLVALKMLTMGRDEILAKVFEREIRTLADLDPRNIVRLLDHGVEADGTPFVVLEWGTTQRTSPTATPSATTRSRGRKFDFCMPSPPYGASTGSSTPND